MKLTDFRYELEGLNIPDAPLKERDSAKLKVQALAIPDTPQPFSTSICMISLIS